MVLTARNIYFFLLSFLLMTGTSVFTHGGRTDSQGGHWNHETGEYHYHNNGNRPMSASAKAALEERRSKEKFWRNFKIGFWCCVVGFIIYLLTAAKISERKAAKDRKERAKQFEKFLKDNDPNTI